MGIARYLSKLAGVLSADGVVPATKGGTGITSPGASGNVLVSDGTSWTSQNIPLGATGPTGPGGLGFTIAKTYSSVAQLTADTSPTGIQPGQFALIDTGDTNNPENSRLYVWTGSAYTYTSDLSGAQGIVGPTGPAGTDGIIGVNGATGPTGPAGPAAGSANQIVYKDGTNTATGSANLTFDGTNLSVNGNLKSNYSVGDEGGELFLAKPQTNSTIGGTGVTVDIYQNKLRIFEQGGTNRGAYLDLTAQAAGVGTALGAGASGGGASYDAGDVVVSAKASKYTAPTWLPCDGAMYTPGTYPGLDTLYQTPGDYSVTPGLFTEPRNTDGSGISWGSTITAPAHSILDPITGDLLAWNVSYPIGSRVLYVQRASDGRFVYDSTNQLALDIQSDFGSIGQVPAFAISPDGQLLVASKYSGGYLTVVYKRNTLAQETATGKRWVRQLTTAAVNQNTLFYGLKISNNGAIIFGHSSTSYFGYIKYDIPSNTISGFTLGNFQTYFTGNYGVQGIDWYPALTNYACFATGSTSYASGMYAWNGSGYSAVSTISTLYSYYSVTINTAGTAAYFSRNGTIEIYNINSSSGALTFNSSITVSGGGNFMQVSFSQGDAFMVVNCAAGILMYQRTSAGAVTYTATGYSPENYSSYGVANTSWKVLFDPVYNTLVGFGYYSTVPQGVIVNWKGTPKTIVPATASPGNKLKYYIKTGN